MPRELCNACSTYITSFSNRNPTNGHSYSDSNLRGVVICPKPLWLVSSIERIWIPTCPSVEALLVLLDMPISLNILSFLSSGFAWIPFVIYWKSRPICTTPAHRWFCFCFSVNSLFFSKGWLEVKVKGFIGKWTNS